MPVTGDRSGKGIGRAGLGLPLRNLLDDFNFVYRVDIRAASEATE